MRRATTGRLSTIRVPRQRQTGVLVWVDRGGQEELLTLPARDYETLSLSPDGTRLAVRFVDPETSTYETDIVDLEGNILTSPRGIPRTAVWGPDGDSLHYVDPAESVRNLWAWPLDGSPPTRLTSFDDSGLFICGWSWSMDGKHLAVVRCRLESDAVIIRDFH